MTFKYLVKVFFYLVLSYRLGTSMKHFAVVYVFHTLLSFFLFNFPFFSVCLSSFISLVPLFRENDEIQDNLFQENFALTYLLLPVPFKDLYLIIIVITEVQSL